MRRHGGGQEKRGRKGKRGWRLAKRCMPKVALRISRKLIGHATYFVIPAEAGIQAAPRQSVETTKDHRGFVPGTPPHELTADLGTAWIPAFAGMTDRGALRVRLRRPLTGWRALRVRPWLAVSPRSHADLARL